MKEIVYDSAETDYKHVTFPHLLHRQQDPNLSYYCIDSRTPTCGITENFPRVVSISLGNAYHSG